MDGHGPEMRRGDAAALPAAYGSDRLELMMRDPGWVHAYWDISGERVRTAFNALGGGKSFLRLLSVPGRDLVTEVEVWAERGSYGLTLPHGDWSYVAELAITHQSRTAVLARSRAVQSPPLMPRAAAVPAFVSWADRHRALAGGLTLGAAADAVLPTWRAPGQVPTTLDPALAYGDAGSELRLLARDSVLGGAHRGSEGRLAR